VLASSSLCFCQQGKLQLSSATSFHVGLVGKDGRQLHLQDCMQAVHTTVLRKVQSLDLKPSHRAPPAPEYNKSTVLEGRGCK